MIWRWAQDSRAGYVKGQLSWSHRYIGNPIFSGDVPPVFWHPAFGYPLQHAGFKPPGLQENEIKDPGDGVCHRDGSFLFDAQLKDMRNTLLIIIPVKANPSLTSIRCLAACQVYVFFLLPAMALLYPRIVGMARDSRILFLFKRPVIAFWDGPGTYML